MQSSNFVESVGNSGSGDTGLKSLLRTLLYANKTLHDTARDRFLEFSVDYFADWVVLLETGNHEYWGLTALNVGDRIGKVVCQRDFAEQARTGRHDRHVHRS